MLLRYLHVQHNLRLIVSFVMVGPVGFNWWGKTIIDY